MQPVRRKRGEPKEPDPNVWITTLWLRTVHRDAIEDLARKLRNRVDYKPSISEFIRGAVDAALDRLKGEKLEDLDKLLEGKSSEESGPIFEAWLRARLGKK